MKALNYIILFCFFFGTPTFYAQNAENVKSPKIICPVKLGETIGFGNKWVKFAKVLSDSRCPVDVTCVWAGEAKVLVEIYEGEKLLETKEVVISPTSEIIPLFSLKNNSVGIDGLAPYPNSKTPEANKKYILNLILL
ncbi:MAG TPA: hypothetical protein VFM82_04340 [Flavobacteriaceae bacterium]|nr:hypothetical protein [Flavobacteriaceae bacterium]